MADSIANDVDEAHDKKRRRIALACNACRTRKSKCDGARPKCASCANLGFDCVYAHSAAATNVIIGKEYLTDLEERLITVEQTLQNLVQGSNTQEPAPLNRPGGDQAAIRPNSTLQPSPRRGADADRAVVFAAEGDTGFFGPSSNIALVRQITKAAADRSWDDSTAAQLNKLAFGPGDAVANAETAAPRALDEPVAPFAIPPFEILHARVQHYFQWTAVLYPFIHRDSFMATLATLRHSVTNVRRTWLGILNIMQALAHNIPVSDNTEEGELYYRRAQALCDQQTLENITLEVVQYLLILGQYLQGSQQTMKAWTTTGLAIRAAMQLGLHSSEASKHLAPTDREVRKRVWLICVMLDRNISMTFGRPPAVPDHYVRLPPVQPFSKQPDKAEQDSVDFMNQTSAVNRIMWQVIERLYDGNLGCNDEGSVADSVSNALRVDQDLVEWECRLPAGMELVLPSQLERGLVPSRFQTILTLRRHSVHLLIYRPLLLRLLLWDGHRVPDASTSTLLSRASPNAAESTARSATECIEIVHILLLSGDKAKRTSLGAWWYTLYYTFNAALTLLAIHLISVTPATRQYTSGRLDLAVIQASVEKSIVALRYINPGSPITKKCELYLALLSSTVQAIHSENPTPPGPLANLLAASFREQSAANAAMTQSMIPIQMGSGALAPTVSAGPAIGGGDEMYWENFLLDPGQLDDFGFGM